VDKELERLAERSSSLFADLAHAPLAEEPLIVGMPILSIDDGNHAPLSASSSLHERLAEDIEWTFDIPNQRTSAAPPPPDASWSSDAEPITPRRERHALPPPEFEPLLEESADEIRFDEPVIVEGVIAEDVPAEDAAEFAEPFAGSSNGVDFDLPDSDGGYMLVDDSDLEPASISPRSAPRPSAAPSASARVVMVVEDDASIREMLTRSLGTEYCVYEASDGVVALDMLARMNTPDLLLLDVRMPKMDGLALAGHMRADDRMRRVPIIFLSGLDSPNDVVNGINAGARQYVTKPFKMKELMRRVDRAIKHRSV
jgi:CheY-like chemotaxis protein